MVEVPALLYQLDELLERVDFLSVGSNDLVQFLYAIDRGNPRVSGRFDALSAPVLRALKDIADKSRAHNKPVTVCGELASQPIGALALAALGYRSLSLTPSAIGPVKAMLLDLDCRKAAAFLCPLDRPGQPRRADPRAAREICRRQRFATVAQQITAGAGLVPGGSVFYLTLTCCLTKNSTRFSPGMRRWNAISSPRCRPRPM